MLPWVLAASPFRRVGERDLADLIDGMLARDILYEADGRLTLGAEGERLYGGSSFRDLYAVFDTPPVLQVHHGRSDVGTLDLAFLKLVAGEDDPRLFRLAGRAWSVRDIDWKRGVRYVQPAQRARTPRWSGSCGYLSYEVCQSMKAVLRDREVYPWLRPSAAMELDRLRLGYAVVVPQGASAAEFGPGTAMWHSFAGGASNALLAAALEMSGVRWRRGNLCLEAHDAVARESALQTIAALPELDWPAVAERAAARISAASLIKFQPCLPKRLETELVIRHVFDVAGTQRFVREGERVTVAAE